MTQPRRDVAIYFRQSTPVSGEVPAKPDRERIYADPERAPGVTECLIVENHDRYVRDLGKVSAEVEGTRASTSLNGSDPVN